MSVCAMLETEVPGFVCKRGKVRDVYDIGGQKLLVVATDRISAFDFVLPVGIPSKGAVLTKLTQLWFRILPNQTQPNHFISTRLQDFPGAFQKPEFDGRTMLCLKADEVFPVECIVRGYVTGSGWKDYQKTGNICGIKLPEGLKECERLPEPIFTPSTKAETGHDENISFEKMCQLIGRNFARELRDRSLRLYSAAHELASLRGIIIADTKFEFGMLDGRVILIDEVLTPDSSRFWPANTYQPGHSQPSLDKQEVRDWLEAERKAGRWNGQAPAPPLPQQLIDSTSVKYRKIYHWLNGQSMQ